MRKMKTLFINGMVEKSGVTKKFAEAFWGQLEAFADYCFNKSHSACYGLIAYQTAYLKAHYPSAFMAALLTQDYGNIDRIAIEIAECQRLGVKVLAPDVNESFHEFAVVKETGNIRFGLSAIKNVGGGAIESILKARADGGPFTSIEDFAMRVSPRECNKKAWESFTKCGAFDELIKGDRAMLLNNIELITAYGSKAQKNALSGQIDIFGSLGLDQATPQLRLEPAAKQATTREQLVWEKELMGLYLSSHPLDDYAGYLADTAQPVSGVTPENDGKLVRIGGMVTTARKILTKKGDVMAFVGIEDKSGAATELIVFPKAYAKSPEVFEIDNVIFATGKISARNREGRLEDEAKVMVDSAKLIDYDTAIAHVSRVPLAPKLPPRLTVPAAPLPVIDPAMAVASLMVAATPGAQPPLVLAIADLSDIAVLRQVKAILNDHKGEVETYIVTGGAAPKKIRLNFKVAISEGLITGLGDVIGSSCVVRGK